MWNDDELFIPVTLKSIFLSGTLNYSFVPCFVAPARGVLCAETALPNVTVVQQPPAQLTPVNGDISTNRIREVLKSWKASSGRRHVSRHVVFPRQLDPRHRQQITSVVFLEVTASPLSLQRKCCTVGSNNGWFNGQLRQLTRTCIRDDCYPVS